MVAKLSTPKSIDKNLSFIRKVSGSSFSKTNSILYILLEHGINLICFNLPSFLKPIL